MLGFGEREARVDLQGLPDCVASVRGFFGSAAGPARSIVALPLEAIPQIAATRTLKCRSNCCFRGPSHSVHGPGFAILGTCKIGTLTCNFVEPPIGIEPMTYALREARALPAHALAAPIAREMALIALAALGLSGDPVHDSVHARRLRPHAVCEVARLSA